MRASIPLIRDDSGFTLTELLVVILVVCVLAAIAIPTLLSQRDKGVDAAAKSRAATASQAMIIYEQEHDTFACGTPAACLTALRTIEPGVDAQGLDVSESGAWTGSPTSTGYRVTATGGQLRRFYVDRAPGDARAERGCDVSLSPRPGACRTAAGATAGSW